MTIFERKPPEKVTLPCSRCAGRQTYKLTKADQGRLIHEYTCTCCGSQVELTHEWIFDPANGCIP